MTVSLLGIGVLAFDMDIHQGNPMALTRSFKF